MFEGVVAQQVALSQDVREKAGRAADVIADDEERGEGLVFPQPRKHAWGYFRVGAIVERKQDRGTGDLDCP